MYQILQNNRFEKSLIKYVGISILQKIAPEEFVADSQKLFYKTSTNVLFYI